VAAGSVGVAVGVVGATESGGPDVPARREWGRSFRRRRGGRISLGDLGWQRSLLIGCEPRIAGSRPKTGATEAAATIVIERIEHQQQELVHELERRLLAAAGIVFTRQLGQRLRELRRRQVEQVLERRRQRRVGDVSVERVRDPLRVARRADRHSDESL